MKLITSIPPRRDGTVVVSLAGCKCTFKADEHGDLVADVDEPAALQQLLATGNFEPYDEADMTRAIEIAQAGAAREGDDDQDADDADDADDEDAPDGLPVEANTPPAAKKGKGRKAH